MFDYYDSEIELLGDVGVLVVNGETDLHTAPRFRHDLDETMNVVSGDIIIDLTDLELLDSTGLSVMMLAHDRMRREHRSLVLVVPRRQVLRVFEVTGLRAFFTIVPTRAEATARVGGRDMARKAA